MKTTARFTLSRPTLLTHGENDNRVPVLESLQFAEKAKALALDPAAPRSGGGSH